MEASNLRFRSHLPLTTSDYPTTTNFNDTNDHYEATEGTGSGTNGHHNNNGSNTTTRRKQKRTYTKLSILTTTKSTAKKTLLILVALYLSYRWTQQFVDYVRDKIRAFRYRRKQHQHGGLLFDLQYSIPLEDIPPTNWPVPMRWLLRPHNAKIVAEARNAIVEYGNELRCLLGTNNNNNNNKQSLGRKYLTPWVVIPEKEDQELAKDEKDSNHNNHNNNHQDDDGMSWDDDTDALLFRKRLRARAMWLRGDSTQPHWPLSELPAPVDGRAVVISAGNKQLYYLKTLIYTIRVIHQSPIPIRVVYRDEQDLSEESKQELLQVLENHNTKSSLAAAEIGDIRFIDLSQYFDLDVAQLKGWNLKAFGMLAVPETQIAVMDADVLLLRPPEELFLAKGFQRTGALCYHDRIKPQFYWNVHVYARWLQPNLSPQAEKLVLFGGDYTGYYTSHIQEAGMLLLDKRRRSLGIWAACLIFGRVDIRKYIQTDHMYGDKEIYWTAFEALGEPYEFARYYPGVVGGTVTNFGDQITTLALNATNTADVESIRTTAVASDNALCGRLLHFDDAGNPLWSNGGYMLKEDDWSSTESISEKAMNPKWFIDGGDAQTEDFPNPWFPFFRNIFQLYSTLKYQNQVWALHKALGVECLSQNARQIRNVPEETAGNARKAVQYYFDMRQTVMRKSQ